MSRSREIFEELRNQRDQKISLRTRLVLYVAAEMLVCIVLTFGLDWLLTLIFGDSWKVPPVLEAIVISLLVGVFVTIFLSKQFFDPIKNLREAMAKVADGNFAVQLNEKTSSKEIRELYAGFNMMTGELSSTEIFRSDFISSVSHEFKTPLAAIEGYSTLLQGGDNLDDSQKEYVEKILYNTNRLSTLASSMLLLSKIENQSIPTNQSRYDLDEQIRESILGLESAWEKKDIEFDVDMEDTEYYGNELLLHHVWDNLIGNAIKFNPCGGLIRIRLKHHKKKIVFTIEDSGPGLSEKAEKHLFDKFYQGDSSHKTEGHGLGLALVKKVLDLEGGTVTAENIPGGGCRFTVTLVDKMRKS